MVLQMPGTRLLVLFLFALSALSILTGCGSKDDGPARFHVSGTVTYQGQPVPRGTVIFLPDTTKGTKGPASKVQIVDGKYDTRSEGSTAPISGELLVQVNGFGAEVPNEEFPAPLFEMYETTFNMPPKDATFNIDVSGN